MYVAAAGSNANISFICTYQLLQLACSLIFFPSFITPTHELDFVSSEPSPIKSINRCIPPRFQAPPRGRGEKRSRRRYIKNARALNSISALPIRERHNRKTAHRSSQRLGGGGEWGPSGRRTRFGANRGVGPSGPSGRSFRTTTLL